MSARRAAVVAIGDELTAGELADGNSSEIAARLDELGFTVERLVVLGDDARALERTFAELGGALELVVATGGLGPTLDDVTREAAAASARVELSRADDVLAGLRELYRARRREMPRSNERQAWFPRGATILPNRCGTAPGFRVQVGGAQLFVLPGPPHEMRDMLEREVLPEILARFGRAEGVRVQRFHLLGLAESSFGDRAGDWMARDAEPLMGVTAHQGVLRVTLRARGASAHAALARRSAEFRERFAAEIFSEDDPRPAFAVGHRLIERGISLALAESCTGGLVAQLLTEVPGISAVFREGWITYTNEAKVSRLGVPPDVLAREGAVSLAVAEAMARGAARASGARMSVAITGIAGPGGGTPQKPVGLVCTGMCVDGRVSSHEQRYPPIDRASIRLFAANHAFDLLRRNLPAD